MVWFAPATSARQSVDDCREFDRVIYTPVEDTNALTAGGVRGALQMSLLPTAARVPGSGARQRSPQRTAFFILESPDTTQPGPWNTTLRVYGNEARPLAARIDVADHASYGVRSEWINEKLLFLQIWLGRIVATELIVDVENLSIVSAASANHGTFILPCSEKADPR